ncbi:ATP-dependent Clp protease adaptor ClpS [Roseibium aestuarii]|uniref:ATP-dependent Clp protease adapter protein ClpS n=1 Tax=Roseibium aestuarii TaxID=2600299 RepID=A0ABW4JYW0_9HYPH|nr:ATP-dependent Clp protease adaptor ClpS [Roseibium aestuarii]
MNDFSMKRGDGQRIRTDRPKLYRVVLLNDEFTPQDFVLTLLRQEFRLDGSQAGLVLATAHEKGACMVSVYPRDVAETKAERGIDAARRAGFPLHFTVEPEE